MHALIQSRSNRQNTNISKLSSLINMMGIGYQSQILVVKHIPYHNTGSIPPISTITWTASDLAFEKRPKSF
jgi:hypothetical protein